MEDNKKKSSKKLYMISVVLIITVILISIAIPLKYNKNEITPDVITKENNGLPKLQNFEFFYNLIKEIQEKQSIFNNENTGNISENEEEQNNAITEDLINFANTNNNIKELEEADIAKTDDDYIYYISNNSIIIIKADTKMRIVSKISFEDTNFLPLEMYVYGNKLIIIGTEQLEDTTIKNTIANVYNIENKWKPKLKREIKIEGIYVTSRIIEDKLFFISKKGIDINSFNENIEEINPDEYKPRYVDSFVSEEEQLIDYSDISYFPESEEASYLNIASLSLNSEESANIDAYFGAGEEIYISLNNLYVLKTKYEYKDEKVYGYYNNLEINTYIYKFKLDGAKYTYENVGSVPGRIINKYSIDEKEGALRVATTNSKSNNEKSTNNIYILDTNLQIIGQLEDLIKEAKVYSVKFINNRAYIITHLPENPLYIIDLTNTENLTVLGELQIPGYSKYFEQYDETHIIVFGKNTEVNEDGEVQENGIKVALYNIEDITQPQEQFSEIIGEKVTASEILNNHKSILFSKEKNIIAFPIYITEEIQAENEEELKTNYKFQGAVVYNIDLENGFIKKKDVSHQEETEEYDNTKTVERIVLINNNMYTLSPSLIKSINIETMKEQSILDIK